MAIGESEVSMRALESVVERVANSTKSSVSNARTVPEGVMLATLSIWASGSILVSCAYDFQRMLLWMR